MNKSIMMSDALDVHQIFLTNIRLLGFDVAAMEKKYHIPFNLDMFNLPNKKGCELVVHFLFQRLNSTKSKEEFRDCWPICDKKQEAQFYKICCNWWMDIAQNDLDSHLPRINSSMFQSPGGDKCYQLLCHFSRYVMYKVIQTEHCVKPEDFLRYPVKTAQNASLSNVMAKMLRTGVARHRALFIKNTQAAVATHEKWEEHAREAVKSYRSRAKRVRELELLVQQELERKALNSAQTTKGQSVKYDADVERIKRASTIQKVRDFWKLADNFISDEKDHTEIVKSLLDSTCKKHHLNADELNVRLPDLLLRECEREIQQQNVGNIYKRGKLDLLSVINLWNLALQLIVEKLQRAKVNDFSEASTFVTSRIHTQQAHLKDTRSLRRKAEMLIPELKESINDLKKRLDLSLETASTPSSLRSTSVGLDLLPPTPPVNFEAAEERVEDLPMLTQFISRHDNVVSTPEAADLLLSSLKDHVQKKSHVQGSQKIPSVKAVHVNNFDSPDFLQPIVSNPSENLRSLQKPKTSSKLPARSTTSQITRKVADEKIQSKESIRKVISEKTVLEKQWEKLSENDQVSCDELDQDICDDHDVSKSDWSTSIGCMDPVTLEVHDMEYINDNRQTASVQLAELSCEEDNILSKDGDKTLGKISRDGGEMSSRDKLDSISSLDEYSDVEQGFGCSAKLLKVQDGLFSERKVKTPSKASVERIGDDDDKPSVIISHLKQTWQKVQLDRSESSPFLPRVDDSMRKTDYSQLQHYGDLDHVTSHSASSLMDSANNVVDHSDQCSLGSQQMQGTTQTNTGTESLIARFRQLKVAQLKQDLLMRSQLGRLNNDSDTLLPLQHGGYKPSKFVNDISYGGYVDNSIDGNIEASDGLLVEQGKPQAEKSFATSHHDISPELSNEESGLCDIFAVNDEYLKQHLANSQSIPEINTVFGNQGHRGNTSNDGILDEDDSVLISLSPPASK